MYQRNLPRKLSMISQSPNRFMVSSHRDPIKISIPLSQLQSQRNVPMSDKWHVNLFKVKNSCAGSPKSGSPKSIVIAKNINNFMRDQNKRTISVRVPKKEMNTPDEVLERDPTSIQGSPGLQAYDSVKSIPLLKQYISSKKEIYSKNSQAISRKLTMYQNAHWKMVVANDENELMDFDYKYHRRIRRKRLRKIVYFLLQKSRQLQISLQDLIDNRITNHKPFQTQGSYAFIYNVKRGQIRQVEQHLQNTPLLVHDFDEKLMTPLHIATNKNNIEMVQLLLKYNAHSMSKDMLNQTPLHYAIINENYRLIELYLSIQCPSDLQYAEYCKCTKNPQIHEMIRRCKLRELLSRTHKYPLIQLFLQSLLD